MKTPTLSLDTTVSTAFQKVCAYHGPREDHSNRYQSMFVIRIKYVVIKNSTSVPFGVTYLAGFHANYIYKRQQQIALFQSMMTFDSNLSLFQFIFNFKTNRL